MFSGRPSFGLMLASLCGLAGVGCFGNKNKEVAEPTAPPPAAYPDTSSNYAGTDSTVPVTNTPSLAETNKPVPRAPEPFSLREGEQLVPYQIESGDSLTAIAAKFNTSISRIQAANGMTDTKIFAGRTLQVPTSAAPPNSNMAMNSAPTPPVGETRYGSAPGYDTTAGGGSYPSTTDVPAPPAPPVNSTGYGSYPGMDTAAPPTGSYSSTTSYPRVETPPTPPEPSQSFPTPTFGGGGGIQFSE